MVYGKFMGMVFYYEPVTNVKFPLQLLFSLGLHRNNVITIPIYILYLHFLSNDSANFPYCDKKALFGRRKQQWKAK